MYFFIFALLIIFNTSRSQQADHQTSVVSPKETAVSVESSQPSAPAAPSAPSSLPVVSKAIGAQAKLSPLDPYISIKPVQEIIAGYCAEWVPYRTFKHRNSTMNANMPSTITFSQEEDRISAVGDETITTWNIKTKELAQRTIEDLGSPAVFSPNGKYLVRAPSGNSTPNCLHI